MSLYNLFAMSKKLSFSRIEKHVSFRLQRYDDIFNYLWKRQLRVCDDAITIILRNVFVISVSQESNIFFLILQPKRKNIE